MSNIVCDAKDQLKTFSELFASIGEVVGAPQEVQQIFGRDAERAEVFLTWIREGLDWIDQGFALGLTAPILKSFLTRHMDEPG